MFTWSYIRTISILFFMLMASSATASGALQSEAQRLVAEAIGCGVDEKSYERFNRLLERIATTPDEKSKLMDQLVAAHKWQQGFWDSAFQSAKQRKVVHTTDYEAAFAEYSSQSVYSENLEKAERMLERIASAKPVQIPVPVQQAIGQSVSQIVVDEELAAFIRDNVGVGTDRVRALLSDSWPPEQQTFTYLEQNILYHSNVRLAMRPLPQQHRSIKQWESLQTLNCASTFSILIEDFSAAKEWQTTSETYFANLEANGMQALSATSGTWHGYPYDETVFVLNSQGQRLFIAVRTIVDLNTGFNYSFSVTSSENSIDAMISLQRLLTRISIMQ